MLIILIVMCLIILLTFIHKMIVFLALMGLLMLTTALACCGKKCQTSKKSGNNYEKIDSDTRFDDIYQPLISQTTKHRNNKPFIQTNITTSFI